MDLGAAGVMIAPPNTLRTDDQIVTYYHQAVEAIGDDVPFVLQDYPLTFSVQMAPSVIRRIVTDLASCVMLKHEDWPGLEKISALRRFEAEGAMRHISILCRQQRPVPGLRNGARRRRRQTPAIAFPTCCATSSNGWARANARPRMICSMHTCRCCATSSNRGWGWAVRKYVMMRRGILSSAAQRRPGAVLTPAAKAEVDHLLARLAKHDPPAKDLGLGVLLRSVCPGQFGGGFAEFLQGKFKASGTGIKR